jgi:hypothetical protein
MSCVVNRMSNRCRNSLCQSTARSEKVCFGLLELGGNVLALGGLAGLAQCPRHRAPQRQPLRHCPRAQRQALALSLQCRRVAAPVKQPRPRQTTVLDSRSAVKNTKASHNYRVQLNQL